jgi:2-dehydropantoate 2-reductase
VTATSPSPLGSERILVVGAGALGSLYSALMTKAGADVWLFGKPSQVAAIEQQGGIWVERGGGSELVSVTAVADAGRLPPPDVLILLTKGQDSRTALDALQLHRPEVGLAVSFQNGVEKDRILGDWCGPERVAGGATMVGSSLIGPGRVRFTREGTTFLGELPQGTSTRTHRLGALLEAAGFKVAVSARVLSVEWSKLAEAVAALGLSALTRLYFHELLLAPELARLYRALIVEVAAVARAARVELGDWPDISAVRTLSELPEEQAVELLQAAGRDLEARGLTGIRTSMLQSVERGRKLELEPIHGFLVREAARLGVSVKNTEVCYRLLAGIDAYLS